MCSTTYYRDRGDSIAISDMTDSKPFADVGFGVHPLETRYCPNIALCLERQSRYPLTDDLGPDIHAQEGALYESVDMDMVENRLHANFVFYSTELKTTYPQAHISSVLVAKILKTIRYYLSVSRVSGHRPRCEKNQRVDVACSESRF
jgi:hypothetical protein